MPVPAAARRIPGCEFLIAACACDPAAIRASLPRPLEPDGSNQVFLRFVATPESFGVARSVRAQLVVPAAFGGDRVDYVAQHEVEQDLPDLVRVRAPDPAARVLLRAQGSELAAAVAVGAQPVLAVTLQADPRIGGGLLERDTLHRYFGATQVRLKRVLDARGRCATAQLVGFDHLEPRITSLRTGAVHVQRGPHAWTPAGTFPLGQVLDGVHVVADLTPSASRVLFDYRREAAAEAARRAEHLSGLAKREYVQ
jgi:acetoacetate decarboxylase